MIDRDVWQASDAAGYVTAMATGRIPQPEHFALLGLRFVDATSGAVEFE